MTDWQESECGGVQYIATSFLGAVSPANCARFLVEVRLKFDMLFRVSAVGK